MITKYSKTLCCSPPKCCVDFAIINENADNEDLFIELSNESGNLRITKGDSLLLLKELIVLFANKNHKCPTLEMDTDNCTLTITDDDGGKVFLTFPEMTVLAQRFLEHV